MDEKLNCMQAVDSHTFPTLPKKQTVPPYLVEVELDKEWEKQRQQASAQHCFVSSKTKESII